MRNLSNFLVPSFVLGIIIYAFKKKVNIYDSFLVGAKDGLVLTFKIAPAVIAMVFATNIFLNSGFLNYLFSFLNPLLNHIGIPLSILPMAMVRPISGTASLAIMSNIFSEYGPDSFVGRLASNLQGCTDTTIYVLALYFSSVKITKTKHALSAGLFADFIGIVAAFIITMIFFA